MSADIKKGCPELDLERQYRSSRKALEEKCKKDFIDAVNHGTYKASPVMDGRERVVVCGCVLWFSFMFLVGFTGAACVSWIFNHSMPQAFLHGLLGWLYICYKAFWYVVATF